MVKAKAFVYGRQYQGAAQPSDFRLIEENLRPLENGEYLVEAIYISVDPSQRVVGANVGKNITAGQVGRIIESKNPKFPVGELVFGYFGWRTLTIAGGDSKGHDLTSTEHLLPDLGNLSPSLMLGILGMPGMSAYFGFLELKAKAGETLLVSGAAGAVGSLVGQIGKIKGLKVIGIAGSDEKGKWLTTELGFDHFINYKKENVSQRLKELAPEGIDCYLDNVGGNITKAAFANLNNGGRVVIMGLIALYDEFDLTADLSTAVNDLSESVIFFKELTIQGFNITSYWKRWMEGVQQHLKWIKEGKLKYKETVTEGFENTPKAFVDMLNGGNTGKAVIKI